MKTPKQKEAETRAALGPRIGHSARGARAKATVEPPTMRLNARRNRPHLDYDSR